MESLGAAVFIDISSGCPGPARSAPLGPARSDSARLGRAQHQLCHKLSNDETRSNDGIMAQKKALNKSFKDQIADSVLRAILNDCLSQEKFDFKIFTS